MGGGARRIVGGGLRRGASPVDWLGRQGLVRHSCGSEEELRRRRGRTWGSRRGRGDGAWRRAVWAAARAGSSAVGSVAVRLPSIGSGGMGP